MHLGALALAALAPRVPTPPQGVCAHHQGGGLREAVCSGPCGHLCAVWLLGLAMGGAGGDSAGLTLATLSALVWGWWRAWLVEGSQTIPLVPP